MQRLARIILGVGAITGAVSASVALVQVGSDSAYHDRLVYGIAALGAALLTIIVPLLLRERNGLAGALSVVCGLVGFVAINLYYINTFYFAALPLWLVGGIILAFAGRAAPVRHSS